MKLSEVYQEKEKKSVTINTRITPTQYAWIKKKKVKISKIFDLAIDELMCQEQ